MSTVGTRRDEIAKRYGGVLFDLAQENKTSKTVSKDVALLINFIEEAQHDWRYFVGPTVSLKSQCDIVEKLASLLKLDSLMRRFLNVISQNRRLKNLSSILEEFKARNQEAGGFIEGVIETTIKLSKKEVDTLQLFLKQELGKEVFLRQEIKESILGGVVLRIGAIMIDVSLETKLNKLRQVMKG